MLQNVLQSASWECFWSFVLMLPEVSQSIHGSRTTWYVNDHWVTISDLVRYWAIRTEIIFLKIEAGLLVFSDKVIYPKSRDLGLNDLGMAWQAGLPSLTNASVCSFILLYILYLTSRFGIRFWIFPPKFKQSCMDWFGMFGPTVPFAVKSLFQEWAWSAQTTLGITVVVSRVSAKR